MFPETKWDAKTCCKERFKWETECKAKPMRSDNIAMLQDTLSILEKGTYRFQGKTIPLKLSRAQMEEVQVYLPQDVQRVCNAKDFEHVQAAGRCEYSCENMDSFSLARKRTEQLSSGLKLKGAKPILVLNLANPVNPGGGVRRGAFGCGAFRNDAGVVSDLFYKALKEFNFDDMREKDCFRSIDFAVLSRSANLYNFKEFSRNFSCFYRDEDQEEIGRALEKEKETRMNGPVRIFLAKS